MEDAWWVREDYLDLFVEDVKRPPSSIHLCVLGRHRRDSRESKLTGGGEGKEERK